MDARALAFASAVLGLPAGAAEPGHARVAVVLAAIDGSLSESDRLGLEAALAAGLKESDRFEVQPQAYVDQVLASSGDAGVRCGFADEVSCFTKIGLAGDFDFLVVARAAPHTLELRLVDVQHGKELKSTFATVDGFGRGPVAGAVASLLDAAPSGAAAATTSTAATSSTTSTATTSTAARASAKPSGNGFALVTLVGAGIGGTVAVISFAAIGGIELGYESGTLDGHPDELAESQWAERILVGAAGVGVVVVVAAAAGFAIAEAE